MQKDTGAQRQPVLPGALGSRSGTRLVAVGSVKPGPASPLVLPRGQHHLFAKAPLLSCSPKHTSHLKPLLFLLPAAAFSAAAAEGAGMGVLPLAGQSCSCLGSRQPGILQPL